MRNPKVRLLPRNFGVNGTVVGCFFGGGMILCIVVAALVATHGPLVAQKGNGTIDNASSSVESPQAKDLAPMQRYPVKRIFRRADAFGREEPVPPASTLEQRLGTLPFIPLSEGSQDTPLVPGPPERLYQTGLRVLRQGDPETARQRLQAFATSYPEHPLVDNARYWIGETWYSQGAYTQAITVWLDAVALAPSSPKTPAALLKIGYARFALGQPHKGRHCLQCLLRTSPPQRIAALAREKLREES